MVLIIALLAVLAAAGPVTEYALKRDALPTERIRFTLALRQRNVQALKDLVTERSTPTSPSYAKWLTMQEVQDMTSPVKADKLKMFAWLRTLNLRVTADRGDNVIVEGTALAVEQAFHTNVTVYAHARTKRELYKCDRYTIPAGLELVEMLVGLAELPLVSSIGPKEGPHRRTKKRATVGDDSFVIPAFVRDIYQVSEGKFPLGSLAVVEFLDYSSYDKGELSTMLKQTNEPQFSVPANQTIGPFAGDGLESVLDVQYGLTLARGGSVWFWTGNRWLLDFAQQVSATGVIPSVFSMSWGWPSNSMCAQEQGPAQCATMTSQQYTLRVDTEFAKIAARGVTLVGASGDQGAPGDNFYQCQPGLSDIMPASSLWVTAVGATQLGAASRKRKTASPKSQPYGAPVCRSLFHPLGVKCADGSNKHEITCSYAQGALITSGGGFQAYLPMPAWQKQAVVPYLGKAKLPSTQYFNASNRAFPDVSALGHQYLVFDSGTHEGVDGTSASTPVFGAMVALWNSQRRSAGKSTLGHIAPLLYTAFAKDPTMFQDITEGDNSCTETCCSMGFPATTGWDAATGVGTPNWAKLSAYIATLP